VSATCDRLVVFPRYSVFIHQYNYLVFYALLMIFLSMIFELFSILAILRNIGDSLMIVIFVLFIR